MKRASTKRRKEQEEESKDCKTRVVHFYKDIFAGPTSLHIVHHRNNQ